jgi:hypothetical protein
MILSGRLPVEGFYVYKTLRRILRNFKDVKPGDGSATARMGGLDGFDVDGLWWDRCHDRLRSSTTCRTARAAAAIAWCGSSCPVRRLLRSRSGVSRNSRGSRASSGASGVSGGAFSGGATISVWSFGAGGWNLLADHPDPRCGGRGSRQSRNLTKLYTLARFATKRWPVLPYSSAGRTGRGTPLGSRPLSSPATAYPCPGRTPPIEAASSVRSRPLISGPV